jgi:hypothetical protein
VVLRGSFFPANHESNGSESKPTTFCGLSLPSCEIEC